MIEGNIRPYVTHLKTSTAYVNIESLWDQRTPYMYKYRCKSTISKITQQSYPPSTSSAPVIPMIVLPTLEISSMFVWSWSKTLAMLQPRICGLEEKLMGRKRPKVWLEIWHIFWGSHHGDIHVHLLQVFSGIHDFAIDPRGSNAFPHDQAPEYSRQIGSRLLSKWLL